MFQIRKHFLFLVLILSTALLYISIRPPIARAEISLEGYCRDGYYYLPGETTSCSRAPNCGGYGYDELNTTDKMPNPQACMGDGAVARGQGGCAGYVPACCYEVARTGDFTKCIGYWERLWCAPSQCAQAVQHGASDAQCGDSCQCGHAYGEYCGNAPVVPVEQRLGIAAPTATQAPTRAPAATPMPSQGQTPTTLPTNPPATPTPIIPSPTMTLVPITPFTTPTSIQTQKSNSFVPKGIIFIKNPSGLEFEDTELRLISTQTNRVNQTKHYAHSAYGTFIHFILLPVDAADSYSVEVLVKAKNGVIYHEKGECQGASLHNQCIITDNNPLILEVTINPFIRVATTEKFIQKLMNTQKNVLRKVTTSDSKFEKTINSWFLALFEGILGK